MARRFVLGWRPWDANSGQDFVRLHLRPLGAGISSMLVEMRVLDGVSIFPELFLLKDDRLSLLDRSDELLSLDTPLS